MTPQSIASTVSEYGERTLPFHGYIFQFKNRFLSLFCLIIKRQYKKVLDTTWILFLLVRSDTNEQVSSAIFFTDSLARSQFISFVYHDLLQQINLVIALRTSLQYERKKRKKSKRRSRQY
jgi:hypothetical protein